MANLRHRQLIAVFARRELLAEEQASKTAGYARVSFEGGSMALKRLENYKNMANGVGRIFSKYLEAIQKMGRAA